MPQTQMEAAFSTYIRDFCRNGTYRNGNYVLTMDDFTKLMTQQMPDFLKSQGIDLTQASSRDQIQKLFNDFDNNNSKFLSFDVFNRHLGKLLLEAQMRERRPKSP